jgi:hypothetical protein
MTKPTQFAVVALGSPLRLSQLAGAVKAIKSDAGKVDPEITIEPSVEGERDPFTTGYRIIARWEIA